jgi:predicted protein tyrosine phosphatase
VIFKNKEEDQEQLLITPRLQVRSKIYWIKIASDMFKDKDRKNFVKDSINTNIAMKTRWSKVVFLMIHSHRKMRKKAIGQVTRRTLTINTITLVLKPQIQQAVVKKPHLENNSSAQKKKLVVNYKSVKTSLLKKFKAMVRTAKLVN